MRFGVQTLRVSTWVAWSVSLASYVLGVVLKVVNGESDEAVSEILAVAIQGLALVAIATLSLLILRAQPRNPVGWGIMLAGMGFPLEGFFAEFTEYALGAWGQIGITLFAGWVSRWIWIGAQLAIPLILLYYPDGRLVSPRWRIALYFLWSVTVLAFIFSAFDTAPMEEFGDLPNPLANEAITSLGPLVAIAFIGITLLPLLGVVSLIPRYRRSQGVERQQMKLIAWVGAVAFFFFFILNTFFDLNPVANAATNTLFTLYVGAAITAGIVRYRVFEIDRIISRTLSYAVVVVVLAATFFGLVTAVTSLLPTQDTLAVAASTLAVAGLFNPIRRRVQSTIDRRFNRSAYQAELVSEAFASKLRESLTVEQLIQEWQRTVNESLQPTASGIWLNQIQSTSTPDEILHT